MPHKGPHISIPTTQLVERVLGLSPEAFAEWPEDVRDLVLRLCEELFLVRYNPFVDPKVVFASVQSVFVQARHSLSREYVAVLEKSIRRFWEEYEADQLFRKDLIKRLSKYLDKDCIDVSPSSLLSCSTDATDLRMTLPMLVVSPRTTAQIQAVVRLANELDFSIVPRGGGSGLTGGAIPSDNRTVILSLSKLKKILTVDRDEKILCTQTGVITLDAIKASAEQGLLFTVDPASKAASSIGGNISENSGGPFAFEYGTTLDNILSYKMVTPTGEVIEVERRNHPRHKIMPEEEAVFDVKDEQGNVLDTIILGGGHIRENGLGKDVTNKFLGGLPGVQKEGVDGIITEGCFTLYDTLAHSKVLCLEFFGRSMINAMYVIKDVVALRNRIREQGDLVKISALEEFGTKYVQAIEYARKSERYEGDPNSVLILQLDSDDETALEQAVGNIVDIVEPYDNVDVFTARDDREAEVFWEDRHKLSAISKRTSGFKINEDIVIPIEVIPEFSDFIEGLNLHYMGRAYRWGLQEVGRLLGEVSDSTINKEFTFTSKILDGKVSAKDLNDAELEVRVSICFRELKERYPEKASDLEHVYKKMMDTRITVANHMHAGDGNCHVNIPVDSNNPDMLRLAHEAAETVMDKVLTLKGQVSGEHGIGITKINFLSEEKIQALRKYKQQVDPKNILNPAKLTQRELPVTPYTFSFNRLIQDILKSGLPEKERLINLLKNIQVCNRCGKCKQVCPMYFPEQSFLYHPRNKNIALGGLIEAIYYSQVNRGQPDPLLMDELRKLMEHCTGCGKCTAVCPVKIDTPGVTLHLRSFLEDKGMGGHPIKTRVLHYLAAKPARRIPKAAKMAGLGQSIQNKALGLVPAIWRSRFKSPLFQSKGPEFERVNLAESLSLESGSMFVPKQRIALPKDNPDAQQEYEAVFYFPGCGASLFHRTIGMAGLVLLLKAGLSVVLPREHMCCGYPLLVSGCEEAFTTNQARTIYGMNKLFEDAKPEGLRITTVLTSCGSCRDGLQHFDLAGSRSDELKHMDVVQFLLDRNPDYKLPQGDLPVNLVYHGACHAEWTGVHAAKANEEYRRALAGLTGSEVSLSAKCCGESGLGALTSPAVYNTLRKRKMGILDKDLSGPSQDAPVIVGCPSCKVGIKRSLLSMKRANQVLHTLEFMARAEYGPGWVSAALDAAQQSPPDGTGPRLFIMPEEKKTR